MAQIRIPPGMTPQAAYQRGMQNGAYLLAATIARDYELGEAAVTEAAYRAFCYYTGLGLEEVAHEVVLRFNVKLQRMEYAGQDSDPLSTAGANATAESFHPNWRPHKTNTRH